MLNILERGGASDDNSPLGDPGHVGGAARPHPAGGVRHQHVHPAGDPREVTRHAHAHAAAHSSRSRSRSRPRPPVGSRRPRRLHARLVCGYGTQHDAFYFTFFSVCINSVFCSLVFKVL